MTTVSSSLNLLLSYKTLELVSAEVFRALFLVLWRLSPLSPVSARNLTPWGLLASFLGNLEIRRASTREPYEVTVVSRLSVIV
jgi:hypothetical protein